MTKNCCRECGMETGNWYCAKGYAPLRWRIGGKRNQTLYLWCFRRIRLEIEFCETFGRHFSSIFHLFYYTFIHLIWTPLFLRRAQNRRESLSKAWKVYKDIENTWNDAAPKEPTVPPKGPKDYICLSGFRMPGLGAYLFIAWRIPGANPSPILKPLAHNGPHTK